LFHKQDKVKLVTHCQNTRAYREVVLREYVAYRILNVMADTSFRVRLMRITYVDTDNKNEEGSRLGFVIEDKDRLAKRLGLSVLNTPDLNANSLNPEYANTVSLYHYLIGNTDFSSIRGAKAGKCCHNHALFGNDDMPVWSVPYDFDQSGLVNATVSSYQDKREEILQVLNEVLAVSDRSVRQMTAYIERFYNILDSEQKVNKEFIKGCI
jgi:hypothetical protein